MFKKAIIHIFSITICFLCITGCSIKSTKYYTGTGYALSETEEKTILSVVIPDGECAKDMGSSSSEDSMKHDCSISSDQIQEREHALQELDGYKLESGDAFKFESSLVLYLYQMGVEAYDRANNCDGVEEYIGKTLSVIDNEDFIPSEPVVMPSVYVLYFKDSEGYEENKARVTTLNLSVMDDAIKNCVNEKKRLEEISTEHFPDWRD